MVLAIPFLAGSTTLSLAGDKEGKLLTYPLSSDPAHHVRQLQSLGGHLSTAGQQSHGNGRLIFHGGLVLTRSGRGVLAVGIGAPGAPVRICSTNKVSLHQGTMTLAGKTLLTGAERLQRGEKFYSLILLMALSCPLFWPRLMTYRIHSSPTKDQTHTEES